MEGVGSKTTMVVEVCSDAFETFADLDDLYKQAGGGVAPLRYNKPFEQPPGGAERSEVFMSTVMWLNEENTSKVEEMRPLPKESRI